MEGIIFGIENPLLDISATVSDETIKKYEVPLGGAILASEKHMPVYEELASHPDVEYIAGGSTLNVLRVCQWMLQQGPNSASFVGCIGRDKFGEEMTRNAQKFGVNVDFLIDEETPTGTCACLINGKERALIANLGAANKYKFEHLLLEDTQKLMKKANFYYSSGFFLTVSPDSMLHVATHAAENNKVFMTNLSALFIVQFFKDKLLAVLPYADYLFGNEDEARAFAKAMDWNTSDVLEIAVLASKLEKVNKKRERVVVFTQAAKPVCVAIHNGDKVDTFTFDVPTIPTDEVVDSNGAGDSFAGGFISQLILGKPIAECVAAGNYAAGVVMRHSGCTYPDKPDYPHKN